MLTAQMVATIEDALAVWPLRDDLVRPFDLGRAITQIVIRLSVHASAGASLAGLPDEPEPPFQAGYQRGATALVWTLHFLTQQPAFQQQVRQEVDHVLGRRNPTFSNLAHLADTTMLLQEAFRYALPFWRLTGQSGSTLPLAAQLAARQLVIHQRPTLWAHAGCCAAIHEPAIRPDLALLQGQLVLAMILQRYELAPWPDPTAERSPDSLWVTLARRA